MKCEKFAGGLDGRRGGLLEPFAVVGIHGEDHDIQVALLSERLLGGIYAVGRLLDLPPGVDGSAREFTDLFRVGRVVRVVGNGVGESVGHGPRGFEAVDGAVDFVAQDVRHVGRTVVVDIVHFDGGCNRGCAQVAFPCWMAPDWVCSLTLRNKPAVASRGLPPLHAMVRCSIGRPFCLSLGSVGGRIACSPADWYIAVDGADPSRNILLETGVMADEVIGRMEWVGLRSVWPHEERNFTPWLLENLDLLSGALGIELHSPSREVPLRGAGRADIVAYVKSDAGDEKAVIENQFGMGDEEHFTRLLGYAEAADASVLVWVASEFSRRHERLVNWFNRRAGAGLAVYLVEASAWQIGDVVGLFLNVLEGPGPALTRASSVTRTLATSLGDFYRPLVARLRASGIPTVGRGGYRGR